MSKVASIVDVLQGKVAIGETVTVRGWVRTRRDSKAGLSFLAVYDGSCFDPIQAIINNDIENYESEILRLTTGCSVIVTGKVVESPAEGQAVELQAEKVEVTGFVEDQILTQWQQNATLLNIYAKLLTYALVPTLLVLWHVFVTA